MPPTKRKAESRIRDRIIDAATHLFCRKGYGATSVSEIVRRVGVSKPVLYYYFKSKAGLFNQLFEEHFELFRKMTERAMNSPGDTRQKLTELTADQFAFCRKNCDRVRFIVSTILGPQKGMPQLRLPDLNGLNVNLHQLFASGIAEGEIRALPMEELGLTYQGMVIMYLLRHLTERHWVLDQEKAAHLVALFFDGIGASSPAKETIS